MRKILAVSSISIGLFVASLSFASAQSLPAVCSVLPLLQQGSNGSTVTILQQFLNAQGDLSATPTGFFGPLTEAGLVRFQDATGISAQAGGNGLFGQFTRAYVLSHFCEGATSSTLNPQIPISQGLLTATPTSGQSPLIVTFSGIGSSMNFGDGTNQSSQNGGALGIINHTYTTAGNYTVTSGNLQTTISVSGSATNPAGSLSSFTNSGPTPLTVTFYVSCSNASTYDVTFGDGTDVGSSNATQAKCNGSLQSFTHTYSSAGSFTATLDLIQQQSNGTFVSQTAGTVGITATGPTTAATTTTLSASPASGNAPLTVTFTARGASVAQSDVIAFGDGSTSTLSSVVCNQIAGAGASCSGNATHIYISAGTFPAKLTDSNGSTLGTASVTVSGNGFSANPSAGAPPLAVQFSYTISASQMSNSYSINFGDGSTSAAQTGCAVDGGGGCLASASHTYTATGTYPAIVSSSGTNLATTTVSVGTCVAPSQNLSLGNSDADSNGQVSVLQNFLVFEGSTIYPAQLVTGFFGNGTLTGVRNFQTKYGIQQTGFVGPLTLAAIAQACSGIAPPPSTTFSFTASPSSGNAPLAVTFTAKNAETPNSSGSYVVAFGDGSQAPMTGSTSSMTVSHTYSQNGTFIAQLLIQQNLCGTASVALGSGCVSDLQVGTTTVTVGNGVTNPSGGSNTIYVYTSGTFGCDTTSQSTCSPSYGNTSAAANSTLVETINLLGSQQSGAIPLYVCSNGAFGQYGAVAVGGNGGFTVPQNVTPTAGGQYICIPGYGASTGAVWGYVYQGPQSGSLALYLLAFPDPGGAEGTAYMMTTRPFTFGGINEGILGYVPSATYSPGGSLQNGIGSF